MSMPRHEYRDRRQAKDGPAALKPVQSRQVLVVVAIVVAVLVPFLVALSGLWSATGRDLSTAHSERDGVVYLAPLVNLIAATADAQSAAVAGARPDINAMDRAIQAVDAVDARYGNALSVSERWSTARKRLASLLKSNASGQRAYTEYSQNLDLLLALAAAVGDSSSLILDPQLDSYYLMDVTLLRVPQLLVSSGRMSDLAGLLGGQASRSPELAAVADQVRSDGAAVKASLGKSFTATENAGLSQGLVPALDRFGDSIAGLTPPSNGITFVSQPAASVQSERARVRAASLTLETASLTQLDRLLQDRATSATSHRRLTLVVTAASTLVVIVVLWFAAPRRRRVQGGPGPDEAGWGTQPVSASAGNGYPGGQEALTGRDLARAGNASRLETER